MEGVITREDRDAMAEVDYIIHHMNERYLNKIPQNVQDFIYIVKKKSAKVYVDPKVPLEKQGLKEFTLYFLMILNLKYWCDDERRKDILLMLENNQREYEDRVNNIFDQAESTKSVDVGVSQNFSKPKQIIVAENPITTSNDVNTPPEQENANNEEIPKSEEASGNALDQLKAETGAAMINSQNENIFKFYFTKIINKIKSLINKK